jgi:hypothetical protein
MMSKKVLGTGRAINRNKQKANSASCWSYYTDIQNVILSVILMVSYNRVLMDIFGSGREEVTGEWNLNGTFLNEVVQVMKSTKMR